MIEKVIASVILFILLLPEMLDVLFDIIVNAFELYDNFIKFFNGRKNKQRW